MDAIRKVHIDIGKFKPSQPTASVEVEELWQPKPKLILKNNTKPCSSFMDKPSKELAYCRACQADRSMLWKPPQSRDKDNNSWFVCAECGESNLDFKMLSYEAAVAKNRLDTDASDIPF